MANELILVVEDNEKNRKLARDVLQFNGFRVAETDNAEEGIRLAKEMVPALILMDFHLPGINGIEALAMLRSEASTKAIPAIAFTASAMTEDRKRIMEAGFDGLQTKPIHVKEFVQAVREAIARKAG
jgi:two-component system cell cycle response regulator DivK